MRGSQSATALGRLLTRFGVGVLLSVGGADLEAAAKRVVAPEWLHSVAVADTPAFARHARAVVLLDESIRQVATSGRTRSVNRRVIRVLTAHAREFAMAAIPYNADFQAITAFEAWLLKPAGDVEHFTRREAADLALDAGHVYTSARRLELSIDPTMVEVGSVLAYSWTKVEKSNFPTARWIFQSDVPVLSSRIAYELPRGWTAVALPYAGVSPAPAREGNRLVWSRRDLPALVAEPWGPSASDSAAAVAIDLVPPATAQRRLRWTRFSTWSDVSRYLADLHDPRAMADAAINVKTRELVAGAATAFDRIKAIARYVQAVNYASIQLGVGRGGGYTPTLPAQVFRRNYGDCKDKTVLMRAMLEAAGLRSYSTFAFVRERRGLVESWPSPQQFDHCIVAIVADGTVTGPAVVEHPDLGRLLIFDPTDMHTPPGLLTAVQQGSRVLIGAGREHDLLTLPFAAPELNRLTRAVEATLREEGTMAVVMAEKATGTTAASYRAGFRDTSAADYLRQVEAWIDRGTRAVRVSRVEPRDHMTATGAFERKVEFTTTDFAQAHGGRLLVFEPAVVPARQVPAFDAALRHTPVLLEPSSSDETMLITLPASFEIAELPPPTEILRSFATYHLSCTARDDGRLQVSRTCVIHAAEIPPERYDEVRSFFAAIVKAERAVVVLQRR